MKIYLTKLIKELKKCSQCELSYRKRIKLIKVLSNTFAETSMMIIIFGTYNHYYMPECSFQFFLIYFKVPVFFSIWLQNSSNSFGKVIQKARLSYLFVHMIFRTDDLCYFDFIKIGQVDIPYHARCTHYVAQEYLWNKSDFFHPSVYVCLVY